MTRLRQAMRVAAVVLGTGYSLFFVSETTFWSLWRADDSLLVRAGGVLFYSFLGYMLLALVTRFRIGNAWGLLVAGAGIGWIGEGVFAMTLFGAGGIPLPFTIAWTALAWHAPLSVVAGWWMLARALRAPRMWPVVRLALGLGVFWGVWGFGWRFETPPVTAEPFEFLVNATVATALLALAHWAIGAGRAAEFRTSRIGIGIAVVVTLGFSGVFTVPQVPFAPLVLLPLLAMVWFALRRAASVVAADAPGIMADFAAPLRFRNVIVLALIPVVATATYTWLRELDPDVQPHMVFAVVASLAGIVLLAVGLWKTVRRPAAAR